MCSCNHFNLRMQRCVAVMFCCRFVILSNYRFIGPQNNPRVQRHSGVSDGGGGCGDHGGLDHLHKELGTRSLYNTAVKHDPNRISNEHFSDLEHLFLK